jgi:tight adherence protein B
VRAPPIEAVASVAQRLAVLLSAGVPPNAAWGYLGGGTSAGPNSGPRLGSPRREAAALAARAAPARRTRTSCALLHRSGSRGQLASADDLLRTVARTAADGQDIETALLGALPAEASADQLTRQGWSALAAVWSVAVATGAPLAESLRNTSASFRDAGRMQRDLQVALAGPAATARLVSWLPAVAVVFGMLMGLDGIGVLVGTPVGIGCLVGGVMLMVIGRAWSVRLVARATPKEAVPGLILDLTAIALGGGLPVDRARTAASAALARCIPEADAGEPTLDVVLGLAAAAGVPAAELLRAEADQRRLDASTAGQERAARLAVRLMIPLGICVLPAFMLLGVAPLLISVVSSTGFGIG